MLKERVVTALVLVLLLGATIFAAPPDVATAVFGVVTSLAGWEWAGLMRWPSGARVAFALAVFIFGAISHFVAEPAVLLAIAALFWVAIVPAWLAYRWQLSRSPIVGAVVGLVVLVPTWASLAQLHQRGPWVLLLAMAVVWVSDIAAYFAGRRFGRRKLAPSISPGKTWEGVAGAIVGVMAYVAILWLATALPTLWSRGLLALVVAVAAITALGVIGDLFESMLKRQAGIKDSSALLPGHGGILDRIDALTSTMPVVALLLGVLS